MTRAAAVALPTCAALLGFAGNSLLCRMALGEGSIDAGSFTVIRMASGAAVLALLVRAGGSSVGSLRGQGSWRAALALAGYAAFFSFAYLRLSAGVGALVLFGAVQLTMLGYGVWRGDRPGSWEWAGLALALSGLLALTLPGASAPDGFGVLLMATAGVAWAAYSLLGRASRSPVAATAGNFLRAAPLALLVLPLPVLRGELGMDLRGLALAVTSGAVTSGLAYTLWYAALQHLSTTRAAILQLSVPALAALGGVLLLGEVLTFRLLAAAAIILGGVAVAVLGRGRAQLSRRR